MKKRISKIANFFAFNLLFFALYLNFIHKDRLSIAGTPQNLPKTAAFSGTAMMENNEPLIEKKSESTVAAQQKSPEKINQENTSPLKLSIN
jgi:hypothetical protein